MEACETSRIENTTRTCYKSRRVSSSSKMAGESVRAVVNYCECVWIWKEKNKLGSPGMIGG